MDLEALANQLINGDITLIQWQAQMREMIRTIYREAAILSAGGSKNITAAQWGYEGFLVKQQYQFLDKFAQDIANNPEQWLNGRLRVRMSLYKEAGRGGYEEMNRNQMQRAGFDEEMRELGEADHCNGCLEQAALGWQPSGTLEPIGSQECSTRCHCTFRYRKSSDEMLFAPAQDVNFEMLFAPGLNG